MGVYLSGTYDRPPDFLVAAALEVIRLTPIDRTALLVEHPSPCVWDAARLDRFMAVLAPERTVILEVEEGFAVPDVPRTARCEVPRSREELRDIYADAPDIGMEVVEWAEELTRSLPDIADVPA